MSNNKQKVKGARLDTQQFTFHFIYCSDANLFISFETIITV